VTIVTFEEGRAQHYLAITFRRGCAMADGFPGPLVVCVRGASRSGKTTLCEALVTHLRGELRVAWVKRTHHTLDLPEKASGRIWAAQPAAMVMRGPDRLQLTLPAPQPTAEALFAALPAEIDLILLETHEPEPFPTILSQSLRRERGERLIGRFTIENATAQAAELAVQLRAMLPRELSLWRMVRAASAGEAHVCPESVVGARLLMAAAAAMAVPAEQLSHAARVTIETAGCAAGALQALCASGVRVLDYGKLAATFSDPATDRTLRVVVRPEAARALLLNNQTTAGAAVGILAALESRALFTVAEAHDFRFGSKQTAPQPRSVTCTSCGDEVFGGRQVMTELGPRCRPCSAEVCTRNAEERESAWR
jgi:molybdopterin-guanine dinucleotide biosynthesis protein MobB